MQHRDCNERGDVKPDSYIQVPLATFNNSAEHVNAENYPNDRYRDIDGPFQFGVLV